MPRHQKLHDRHEQHQHDEIVHRHLHQRIGRVAFGQMAPHEDHRGTGCSGQNDAAGDVLVGFGGRDEAAKTRTGRTAQASSAIENGFTTQLINSVTSSPAGRRPTFRTAREIHLHHHRGNHQPDQHGDGRVDLASLAEFDAAQCRDGSPAEACRRRFRSTMQSATQIDR